MTPAGPCWRLPVRRRARVLHVASQRAILDADIAADDSICYLSVGARI